MDELYFKPLMDKLITGSFSSLVSQERSNQLDQIAKSWDFYYGDTEKYIKQYRGENFEDYQDKDKLCFNYTKLIVSEYIKGVFAKPISVVLDDVKQQEQWQSIQGVNDFSMVSFLTKVQRIAEISNTCTVMTRFNPETKSTYFEEIRGEFCTYLPDPTNPKQIGTLIISYLYDTGELDPEKRFLKRVEIWDKDQWAVWLYSPSIGVRKLVSKGENPYGFIPAVRFQPEQDDNSFFGISVINDIVKVNEVYNNLWSTLMRISVMQSFSVLVVSSDSDLDITLAPTRFLKFEQSEASDAKYITPNPKIAEVTKVLENLKKELMDFSQVPSSVITNSGTVGAESGYSLRVKRIPIEQLYAQRKATYGDSLSQLIKIALYVDSINQNKKVELNEIQPSIDFPPDTLLLSTSEQSVQDESDLRHGIITPIDIMLRKYPKMTREQALNKILANQKEAELINKSIESIEL